MHVLGDWALSTILNYANYRTTNSLQYSLAKGRGVQILSTWWPRKLFFIAAPNIFRIITAAFFPSHTQMCISSHEPSKTTNNHEVHRSLQICGPTQYGTYVMLCFWCLQFRGGTYTSVKFIDLWLKESYLSADCCGHMESENLVQYTGNWSHKVVCNTKLVCLFLHTS